MVFSILKWIMVHAKLKDIYVSIINATREMAKNLIESSSQLVQSSVEEVGKGED